MLRFNLRTTVILSLVVYHIVLVVFLVIPYGSYIHELMEDELRVTGDETLKLLDVLIGGQDELDQATQERLNSVIRNSEVFDYLALSDTSGNVIYRIPRGGHEDEEQHADQFGYFDFMHSTGHSFERSIETGNADQQRILSLVVNTQPFNSQMAHYLYSSLKLAFGVMTVFLGVVLFADRRLRHATRHLIEKTRRMSEGDLDTKIQLHTGDAMEQLALSFNEMAASLQKRTAELTAIKNLNESLVDSINQGLALVDLGGRITHCNQSFAKLFGMTATAIIGSPLTTFLSYLSSGELAGITERLIAGENVKNTQRQLPHGDQILVVNEHWTVQKDPEGKIEWFVLLIDDVTEQARLSSELEHYTLNLEQLVEEKTRSLIESQEQLIQAEKTATLGVFAAGVAHEISNPLAGILSTVELMQRDISDKWQTACNEIIANILRVQGIINDLVDYARPTYDVSENVDLGDLIERVISFYRRQPKFRNHEVKFMKNSEVGQVSIDANKLEHVLHNLLLNALQATGEQGSISLSVEVDEHGKGYWIEVADNGPGVPDGIRKDIFTPFFSTKPAGQGTGLGLPLSQRLMKEMGGELFLATGTQRGAKFVVILPEQASSGTGLDLACT